VEWRDAQQAQSMRVHSSAVGEQDWMRPLPFLRAWVTCCACSAFLLEREGQPREERHDQAGTQ